MSEGVMALPADLTRQTPRRRVRAVVLAGGKGTRLAPYTSILPKPLMPIGDRSILELMIGQFAGYGITEVTLCVGHLAHLIEAVLGHRANDGVEIRYAREQEALGTAGPLRLVEGLSSTFIAMNGDVLTTLDYGRFVQNHRRSRNLLTIATHERLIRIDYGVLQLDENRGGNRVQAYVEKPEMTSTVSMGIYAMEPEALEYIPPTGYFDFPDLVQALLRAGEQVGAHRHDGLWFDIGRRDDYEQAVRAWVGNTTSAGAFPTGDRRARSTNGKRVVGP